MGGLTWWSFLMASAHGAGLMVLPVFCSLEAQADGPACHRYAASTQATVGAAATIVHGAGYLAATAVAAWIVVDRLGLGFSARRGSIRSAARLGCMLRSEQAALNATVNRIGLEAYYRQ